MVCFIGAGFLQAYDFLSPGQIGQIGKSSAKALGRCLGLFDGARRVMSRPIISGKTHRLSRPIAGQTDLHA
jgi:hypothetical protein